MRVWRLLGKDIARAITIPFSMAVPMGRYHPTKRSEERVLYRENWHTLRFADPSNLSWMRDCCRISDSAWPADHLPDVPLEQWRYSELRNLKLPDHVFEHLLTMARLYAVSRYDRVTQDIEMITGKPRQAFATLSRDGPRCSRRVSSRRDKGAEFPVRPLATQQIHAIEKRRSNNESVFRRCKKDQRASPHAY